MKRQKANRTVGVFEDHHKVELSETQQNPGAAKPEDFVVNEVNQFSGQNGNNPAERRKLTKVTDSKRRTPYKPTPDRPNVNEAELPLTGSRLDRGNKGRRVGKLSLASD